MKKVLVLCTGNSCRSQMAHGILEADFGDRAEVWSAGVETHGLNPNAVRFMREAGYDISTHTSNHIDEYRDIDFDYVITVCDHALETCPYFPGRAEKFHHNFSDPSKVKGSDEQVAMAFRNTILEIKTYCQQFAVDHL